ncbi:hypothetical protein DFH06DRAFT_1130437 [Mycena polygramma]|nr:hypothetical protein DFH06DRAFT_1130437 [Mycena polygramma]
MCTAAVRPVLAIVRLRPEKKQLLGRNCTEIAAVWVACIARLVQLGCTFSRCQHVHAAAGGDQVNGGALVAHPAAAGGDWAMHVQATASGLGDSSTFRSPPAGLGNGSMLRLPLAGLGHGSTFKSPPTGLGDGSTFRLLVVDDITGPWAVPFSKSGMSQVAVGWPTQTRDVPHTWPDTGRTSLPLVGMSLPFAGMSLQNAGKRWESPSIFLVKDGMSHQVTWDIPFNFYSNSRDIPDVQWEVPVIFTFHCRTSHYLLHISMGCPSHVLIHIWAIPVPSVVFAGTSHILLFYCKPKTPRQTLISKVKSILVEPMILIEAYKDIIYL